MTASSTTPVAANAEDRVGGRACPTAIVAVTAPAIVRTIPGVIVAALASDLAAKIAAVVSELTALGARQRAVRAIDAPLFPNLAPLLAQCSRLGSRQLA